jgi:hypothetical protein
MIRLSGKTKGIHNLNVESVIALLLKLKEIVLMKHRKLCILTRQW